MSDSLENLPPKRLAAMVIGLESRVTDLEQTITTQERAIEKKDIEIARVSQTNSEIKQRLRKFRRRK